MGTQSREESNRLFCLKAACLSYPNFQTHQSGKLEYAMCNSLISHYIISGYFQIVTSHYRLEMCMNLQLYPIFCQETYTAFLRMLLCVGSELN